MCVCTAVTLMRISWEHVTGGRFAGLRRIEQLTGSVLACSCRPKAMVMKTRLRLYTSESHHISPSNPEADAIAGQSLQR